MTRRRRQWEPADWHRFVLANGWRAQVYDLAAVIRQPAEEIVRLRTTGACTRLAKAKDFAQLFTLWNGRAPADDEWPIPRKFHGRGTYTWQAPELALLATLVGRLGIKEIAQVLTARLRKRTGDPCAERTRTAAQDQISRIGLQTKDVLGGITTTEAGREVGSVTIVHQAIEKKLLRASRVGRLWVIPRAAWTAWKATRIFPPEGYVALRTIRAALSIRSDKLSEFARLGHLPTAIRCNPYGKGPSTQYGTWYIDPKVAERLVADRRAGRPMPWHGQPNPDNLRVTFKLWQARKHPPCCETCADIWGKRGAPPSFEDYTKRYPPLAHGAKRHLTRPWDPGLTVPRLAANAGRSVSYVRRAIANAMLQTSLVGRTQYVTRTDATRWIARRCPTGDSEKSWISLATARKQYFFTLRELRAFIASKKLKSLTGTLGAARGVVYVSRHQCGHLREKIGFTEEEAAYRVGVTVARLHTLLDGVNWRKAKGIPLATVQAAIKRLESREGYTLQEAAKVLRTTVEWVKDRIDDGTVRISKAKWDRRRTYVTAPMMERLRAAMRAPAKPPRLSDDWFTVNPAALEAGVSATTLVRWAERGELERRRSDTGWRYQRDAVRVRARRYWKTVRFRRATRPAWLLAEMRARVTTRSGTVHGEFRRRSPSHQHGAVAAAA